MMLVFLQNAHPCFQPTDEQVRRFDALLPESADRPVRVCRSEDEFVTLLPQATAVFVWTFRQEWFALAPRLRHVCTPAAGRDYFSVVPPEGVTMHYGSFHGAIMGETALGAVLACCHGLLQFAGAMTGAEAVAWPRGEMASLGRRLCGSRVAILGYGNIGRHFARMLQPFGALVTGITRRPHPELAGEAGRLGVTLATAERLDSILPETDHLVCFLPSGEGTTNLLDARRLALMKRSAFIYNFGRGNLIDEDALASALSAGRLGGAVLDVFKAEPLPSSSPLRHAPNCWLYPHASAFAPDYLDLYFEKCAGEIAKASGEAEPDDGALFDAVVAVRYGADVRDEILADAELAFKTHFDDDPNRTAENYTLHDEPGGPVRWIDGWISPAMGAWQGEFWGKYMLAGAEVAECRGDEGLKAWLRDRALRFVGEFQQPDGYLCSYASRDFLGGPKDGRNDFAWNVWGRKYTMWALLEIARVCGAPELTEAARRMADQLMAQLDRLGLALRETGAFAGLPSCSAIIPFMRLYNATGDRKYLDFVGGVIRDWDRDDGAIPNLVRNAFGDRPVHEWYPDPHVWAKAYEMMSSLEGIVEYAEAVGGAEGARLLKAVTRVRDKLEEREANRLGAVGDGDHFLGMHGESDRGSELCDIVHWMRLNAALLRATGDAKARGFIETAFHDGLVKGILDGGRWCIQLVKADGTGAPAALQVGMKRHHCCVDNMPRGFVVYHATKLHS